MSIERFIEKLHKEKPNNNWKFQIVDNELFIENVAFQDLNLLSSLYRHFEFSSSFNMTITIINDVDKSED
jgi:hypothetical protein